MIFRRMQILLAMILAAYLLTTVSMADTFGNVSVTAIATATLEVETTPDTPTPLVRERVVLPESTENVAIVQAEVTETEIEELVELPQEVSEPEVTTDSLSKEIVVEESTEWQGEVLNSRNGTVNGPSGKETYYNLDMSGVIKIMRDLGYDYEYYVREDGVKMFGPYIMCAANLDLRPRGTILETTLGTAIVCDTGSFAKRNHTQIDVAVNW